MRISLVLFPNFRARLARGARRFAADCRGVTAIEFGMVATPFFLMMMGIMMVGLQYLTLHSLEIGLESSARLVRTGQAQKEGLTLGGFRQLFCAAAGTYIECNENLVIHLKSGAAFSDLAPATTCVTDGALTPSPGAAGDPLRTRSGAANAAVQVTVCYDWELGRSMWQKIWGLISPLPQTQGLSVISATTAFRSEPFE